MSGIFPGTVGPGGRGYRDMARAVRNKSGGGQPGAAGSNPLSTLKMANEIGLFGLAVMGQNLALNIAEHGVKIAVCNRSPSKVRARERRGGPFAEPRAGVFLGALSRGCGRACARSRLASSTSIHRLLQTAAGQRATSLRAAPGP